ncbi:MAG: SPOR domain-containing protein [Proteobacteria bacterium]|nr:SPOR domain-containing protein [Pseudomonadota bacterium]
MMDPQLKQRVVGAAVLVALFVVFIPVFLDQSDDEPVDTLPIFEEFDPPEGFNSSVVPIDDETMDKIEHAMNANSDQLIEYGAIESPSSNDLDVELDSESTPVVESTVIDSPSSDDSSVEPAPQSAPTEAAPRMGVTAWVVQLGSFSSEDNAKVLMAQLKKKNYTAFIERFQDNSKLAYRVRVGPELTKNAAEQVRNKLAKQLDLQGIVVRYP